MSRDVLIVDDSSVIRQMIKRTLKLAGLDVNEAYEAGNGIEALAQLHDHEVAVMLADINMPTMNGIQLVKRMKQSEQLREIPIVVVSTEGSQERIHELEHLGVFGYLRKPFQPEQLRDLLQPLLGVCDDERAEDTSADSALF